MRQLRQASAQGYNILGRSHDNLHGTFSPSYQPTGYRRDTLRRYASAQTLPHSGGYSAGGYSAPSPNTPVYRISGDFGSMWDRQHTSSASALHKPVFGRGISLRIISQTPCMSPACLSKWAIPVLLHTTQSVLDLPS